MRNAPQLLGILNITEDSFSDGGRFLAPNAALAQARKLLEDGADIIDIGAAASNPDAKPVTPVEEIRRLDAVVPALLAEGARISIDSFNSETQAWAIEQFASASNQTRSSSSGSTRGSMDGRVKLGHDDLGGSSKKRERPRTHYLNDIHGFADVAIYPRLAAARDVKLIVMHAIQAQGVATREKGEPDTIWDRILTFFERRIAALEAAGIDRARLILDPGMGLFLGAGREVSFRVLREMHRLKDAFGLPVLISVSRKSFLRVGLGRAAAESGPATVAAELFAAAQGASYIRTHDVRALKDALATWQALAGEGGD